MKKITKEKCVVCHKETIYDKSEHISFRMAYIDGVGQLCFECYDSLYRIIFGDTDKRLGSDRRVKRHRKRKNEKRISVRRKD